MECIFCKIAAGAIPAYKVYEDGNVLAFLDINPMVLGHTLVIPKVHSITLMDTSDEILGPLFASVKKVAGGITKALNAHGFNIYANNGRAARQGVDHLHIHIVPRFENDPLGHWPHLKPVEYGPGEIEQVMDKIRSELN